MLHNYTNTAVADLCTHSFNDIQYYSDMLLYHRDSGKIRLSPNPNINHSSSQPPLIIYDNLFLVHNSTRNITDIVTDYIHTTNRPLPDDTA